MKIKSIVITLCAILSLSVVTCGFAGHSEKAEPKKTQQSVEQIKKETKEKYKGQLEKNDFVKLMEELGYYPDEISSNISEFVEKMVLYDMSEKDIKELYKLVKKGCDFGKLLDIYTFSQDTKKPGDIEYIAKLYDEAQKVETTSEFWIEEAYNRLENNKHGNITIEDIEYYVEQGISYDEIRELNTLIRKSDYTVKDMLDKKVKGESWAEISSRITNNADLKIEKVKKNNSLSDIRNYIFYSKITGDSISELTDENGSIAENTRRKAGSKIQTINELKSDLADSNPDSEKIIHFAAEKLTGISEQCIKNNLKKGYTIRELEEIKSYTDKHGINFDEYMEALR